MIGTGVVDEYGRKLYTSGGLDGYARLDVIAQGPNANSGEKREKTLAEYELRFLADTLEVVLCRLDESGDWEAVYSEPIGV